MPTICNPGRAHIQREHHVEEVMKRFSTALFVSLLLLVVSYFPARAQHYAHLPEPVYHGSPATNCATCHGDSTNGRLGKFPSWSHTLHAQAYDSIAFVQNNPECLHCHTTGWDTTQANGGFDDYFRHTPRTHADTVGILATKNVQCESCHKPYTQTGVGYDTSLAASKCGECHGGDPHTPIYDDWLKSMHAKSKYTSSGTFTMTATSSNCAGCHTAEGMIQWFQQTAVVPNVVVGDTSKTVQITCAGCHNPHGSKNEHQLRLAAVQLCEKCHNPEYPQDSVGTQVGKAVHNSTAYMFEGIGGYQYAGYTYQSSAHKFAVPGKCVTCHVHQVTPPVITDTTPVYTGHTFVPRIEACKTCHADIDTTKPDFDYRHTQTATDSIAAILATKLATAKTHADSASTGFQRAKFNYDFYMAEGSHGIHNTKYAQGLLISSIQNFSLTGVQLTDPTTPLKFALDQNFPNPFNPSTTISFSVAKKEPVRIQVFDINGQLVNTLLDQEMEAGRYKIVWSGDDRAGNTVASGVYFVKMHATSFESVRKMLMVR
jgi:predicted CXXCH cytochrome family protein